MCGSLEYIKSKYKNVDWDLLIKKKKIYYIGDAFGRDKDFSDTDIKFSINCKIKFKTPEIFFNIDKTEKHGTITYPTIKYMNKKEFDNILKKITNIINTHEKIFIMMIGLPASGKSYLRKELIKIFPQFVYNNIDDINKKNKFNNLIKNISVNNDYIIDDNTNLVKYNRVNKLKDFNSHYKIGIFFDYDLEVCFHLNWMRMYLFEEKLLPKVTYYTLNKKFNKDNLADDFDDFIVINKIFYQFNMDNNIKYYF